jgi:hypothetical protein
MVTGGLIIATGVTARLNAGATLKTDGPISVNGSLVANGTSSAPVTFHLVARRFDRR